MTSERTALLTHQCLRGIGAGAVFLWGVGVAVGLTRAALEGSAMGRTILACFDLDAEQTITAWFSSSLLLAGAALWCFAGLRARETASAPTLPWFACGGITALLSMDETVGLHERLGNAVHRTMPGAGLDTFAWILPGAILVLGLGAFLFRFLRRQAPPFRRRIWVAAACYFGGALGVEALGAWIHAGAGKQSTLYAMEVFVEEGLELAGAWLWVRALALHLLAPEPG